MRGSFVGARHALPLLFIYMMVLVGCNLPMSPVGEPPRPTVVIITATGPYFETFDTPGSGWLLGETTTSIGAVTNGEFVLTVKNPGFMAWTHNQRVFGEGVYEVDIRFISGPEASAYGLLLLAESDLSSFFYIMITDDGRYDIGRCEEWCAQQESLIGEMTLSYSILTGEDTNHLRVELSGGTMTLTINGAPVSTIQGFGDASGLVGFIGESAQFGGFSAAFDNLQVIEPGGPSFAPTNTPEPTPTTPLLLEPTP